MNRLRKIAEILVAYGQRGLASEVAMLSLQLKSSAASSERTAGKDVLNKTKAEAVISREVDRPFLDRALEMFRHVTDGIQPSAICVSQKTGHLEGSFRSRGMLMDDPSQWVLIKRLQSGSLVRCLLNEKYG